MPRVGAIRSFTGTNVAANTEFSETVPTGKFWLVEAVTVSLVQGITQTPQPTLVFDDGVNILFQGFGASSAQSASTTTRYTWAPGNTLTAGAAATVATAPMPLNMVLGPGYRIRSVTIGIGANTDYAAPQIFVVQYDAEPLFD